MEVEEYTATVTMESAAIAWLEAGDTTAVSWEKEGRRMYRDLVDVRLLRDIL